jgi:hypothetical protein
VSATGIHKIAKKRCGSTAPACWPTFARELSAALMASSRCCGRRSEMVFV